MSVMVKTVSNIGNEIFSIVENIAHGISAQTRNTKDLIKLIFLAFAVADILTLGSLGIITYLVTLTKDVLAVVSAEIAKNGYQLLILALVVMMFKDTSSAKRRRR